MIGLHELWLIRCKILCTKLLDGIEIREHIELINELLIVLWEQDKMAFIEIIENLSLTKVKDLLSSTIKGILFILWSMINKLMIILINNQRSTCKELMQEFLRRVTSHAKDGQY